MPQTARAAFLLAPDACPARALVRYCAESLERAEGVLSGAVDDTAVHAVRRELKRARAVLRVLRPALGRARFTAENRALRDVGRTLSRVRDARVLASTLASVAKEATLARAAVRPLSTQLGRELAAARDAESGPARAASLRRALAQARRRLQRAPLQADGWPAVADGLRRVYRRGRAARREARRSPTPECLHAWRKQVKHWWHALEVLEPLWPRVLRSHAREAHRLSDRLGEDHDLALLRARVAAAALDDVTKGAALAAIDARRERLQATAFRIGERLYAERPSAVLDRLGAYWRRHARDQRGRLARGSTS